MNGKISPERYQSYYIRGIKERAEYEANRARLMAGCKLKHDDPAYAKGIDETSQEFVAWIDGWSAHSATLRKPEVRSLGHRFYGALLSLAQIKNEIPD